MKSRIFILTVVCALYLSIVSQQAQQKNDDNQTIPEGVAKSYPNVFPPPGVFKVTSNPIFFLDINNDSISEETITFRAEMELRTGTPFINSDGLRQVDIEVQIWTAVGHSNLFKADIVMQSSEPQTMISKVVSLRPDNDLPALLTFRVHYDLAINGRVLFTDLVGVAQGIIQTFPPTGLNTLKIKKDPFLIASGFSMHPVACRNCTSDGLLIGLIAEDPILIRPHSFRVPRPVTK